MFMAYICLQIIKVMNASYKNIISINPEIRGGRPCIRGMRISVYDILNWLASGMSKQEIIADYPELTVNDIDTALLFVADKEDKTRYVN